MLVLLEAAFKYAASGAGVRDGDSFFIATPPPKHLSLEPLNEEGLYSDKSLNVT